MADHKVQINPLTQIAHDEKNFLVSLNLNLSRLQKAIDDTLSRTGVVPNQMEQVLDMNGKRIINVGKAQEPSDVVTKEYIQDIIDEATTAISRLDKLVADAKIALEVYASEFIYPTAQRAVDEASAAAQSAREAQSQVEDSYNTIQQIADDVKDAKDSASAASTAAKNSQIASENAAQSALNSEQLAAASARAAADSAASIGTVMRYKGSVTTYANLPTAGQVIGDVWNVEDDDSNYAWNGTSWDKLGATFNAENYYTKEQINTISSALEEDINSVETTVNTLQTDLGDLGNQVVDLNNDKQSKFISQYVTLSAGGWNSYNRQTITVERVTPDDLVFVSPLPNSTDMDNYIQFGVWARGIMVGSNQIVFECKEIPTTDIGVAIGVLPK